MDAFLIVALCVVGVIAYVACAGLVFRLVGGRKLDTEFFILGLTQVGALVGMFLVGDDDEFDVLARRSMIAGGWPTAAIAWLLSKVIVAVWLPLRSTLRLTAGLIGKEHD